MAIALLPNPKALENRFNKPPFFLPFSFDPADFSETPSASPSLFVHDRSTTSSSPSSRPSSSSNIGSPDSRLGDKPDDEAEVSEVMLNPDASDESELLDVFRMKRARGGDSSERARRPSSLSWSSRLEDSASEDRRSCGARAVLVEWDEDVEASEMVELLA